MNSNQPKYCNPLNIKKKEKEKITFFSSWLYSAQDFLSGNRRINVS